MRLIISLCFSLCIIGSLSSATAQLDRLEKSKAEIAFEEAAANLEKYKAARSEAKLACEAKDYDACYALGDLYRKGWGGQQDYAMAADFYEKACDGDSGQGCAALAYLTTHGRGVEVDLKEARSLYRAACAGGEVSGCAGYGNMLYTGMGGAKNTAEGTRVLQDACDRGYEWACERLTALGARNPEDDIWQRLKDVGSRF